MGKTLDTPYDSLFYSYINKGAQRSARQIIHALIPLLDVKSVLDIGCGQGAWLNTWEESGVEDHFGVDGDYIELESLLIDPSKYRSFDLSQKLDLGRNFDLVQSLEVAEHIDPEAAEIFIENLTRHGNIVLFSAAPPGQGGDNHINERPYDYWRSLFSKAGYQCFDCLRPAILNNSQIERWYRYNTFLYCNREITNTLHVSIMKTLVGKDLALADVSPSWYKLRKALVRLMPRALANYAAKCKELLFVSMRRIKQ